MIFKMTGYTWLKCPDTCISLQGIVNKGIFTLRARNANFIKSGDIKFY